MRDAKEATQAMLKEMNNLWSLWLIWGSSEGSYSGSRDGAALESPQSSDEAEAVLEALQPPESLNKNLFIKGYSGSVFPRWIELLHNLVRIELTDCINCERLPPLGQLVHLGELTITGMRSLKRIGTEFYGSNSSSGGRTIFPSLVSLTFEDMPKLEKWEDIERKGSQQTEACPCLERLVIERCESLKSLLSNLRELCIHYCDQLESSSEDFQSLISLESLDLANLPKLTSFPALQHFSKLKRLAIRGCKNLISLGPQGMMQNPTTVLRWIRFEDCEQLELASTDFQPHLKLQRIHLESLPKLASIPALQHFSKLEWLSIEGCKNLISLGPQGMMQNPITVLERIEFKDCEQLELSSTAFQHLLELEYIYLRSLPKLTSIPALQHFSKLEELEIKGCKNLISLGPQGMLQNPTFLKRIWLDDCEQLEFSSTDFQHHLKLRRIHLESLPKLTSVPALQHFSKLEHLSIKGCKNLISLGPQGMMQNPITVLRSIEFEDCEQLELSSADFQHLLKLKGIQLISLPKLTSLPQLQHLSSLDRLYISRCKNLKTLPHWLQNITFHGGLFIEGCNGDLELRCAKDTGEYWPFIKHIPKVIIQAGEETPPSTSST